VGHPDQHEYERGNRQHRERTTLRQAALKLGFVSADELDRLVDPNAMRKPFPLAQ
jgi:fumarate hydratase class II